MEQIQLFNYQLLDRLQGKNMDNKEEELLNHAWLCRVVYLVRFMMQHKEELKD
jgi:hypothetical protein